MGAKCIYDVYDSSSETRQPPARVEREIIRRIKAHTGRKSGKWQVTVSIHATTDKNKPIIEMVTLPDVPNRIYFISPPLVTEADPALIPLMRRICSYTPKFNLCARGEQYDFVDFSVRVGMSFDRHGSAKRVIVEIEYQPCSFADDCENLIAELMQRIAAPLVPPPQVNQDPGVGAAAGTTYKCDRVQIDANIYNPKDLTPFSYRSEALLYAKLLVQP